eukprot:361935-Chlamydomonas_euryale.AAC.19
MLPSNAPMQFRHAACLKDLQRFLRNDDPDLRTVFFKLAQFETARKDLLPLITTYPGDLELVTNARKFTVMRGVMRRFRGKLRARMSLQYLSCFIIWNEGGKLGVIHGCRKHRVDGMHGRKGVNVCTIVRAYLLPELCSWFEWLHVTLHAFLSTAVQSKCSHF